ncbi:MULTISPECIES: hypothetical protein [unclassified Rhizobium]|uniref:hypothetical protein n=1 Tax=unclassified Rhizobium TaxID=2613769 RepID=UPI00160D28D9|nr:MULTISPECIES: hypothetical protein [unclassified Rhizobium]MBB3288153.1 hypothetical protein [Rhizobium sp. BK252]MBB3402983.1 hypothetical protein [Rhizobium sp. BK289]MBB3415560.1 hypothetical protein [Rhizobium sp. BK284]MBB3483359.1 hypothetical protein [Rhizobium sp. BK347]
MKNTSSAFLAALSGARDSALVPRQFVWFTAKALDTGAPVSLGIWTGDEDINISVISGVTGLPEARTYYGASNLSVGEIARTSDLTVQTVSIKLSQIATAAQQLVRGYDLRLAAVEIHDMAFDIASRQPVSAPEIAFLGLVDGAPIKTPSVGNEGDITIKCVSAAISMLDRPNTVKSSYEGQKRRNGDEWGLYSSTIANWTINWGQKG